MKYIKSLKSSQRITATHIMRFSRQLTALLMAGIPLVPSLQLIAKGLDHARFQQVILAISYHIASGRSLSEALSHYPKQFNTLYCRLVAAGELSGTLDTMLDRISTYLEKSVSLKRAIKKALTYPACICAVALLVVSILLIHVVPQFEQLFAGLGAELPYYTQLIIRLSRFLQAIGWSIGIITIGCILLFIRAYGYSYRIRLFIDKLSLRCPLVGPLLQKAIIARFARTLSTTVAAGIPLVDALTSAGHACSNVYFHAAVQQLKKDIVQGNAISHAMQRTRRFSPQLIQMVAIGEESGAMESMLMRIAVQYEEDVNNAVGTLSTLLEPAIMVILGLIVGGLVMALYLPIFQMGAIV